MCCSSKKDLNITDSKLEIYTMCVDSKANHRIVLFVVLEIHRIKTHDGHVGIFASGSIESNMITHFHLSLFFIHGIPLIVCISIITALKSHDFH